MNDTALPPDAVQYLKDKKIPALMEHFLHEMMVHMPDDPVQFLVDLIQTPDVPKLIIAGPPGCGKGTQCERIVATFGVAHLSTGEMLRAEVRSQTALGKEAEAYMSKGELVPDHLLITMVKQRLDQEDVKLQGWLLDGFPRTKNQALAMQSMGILPDKFVLIECPDEIVIERIEGRRTDPATNKIYHLQHNPPTDPQVRSRLEQRADDTREVITKRLGDYHRNINEISATYQSILTSIDGNTDADAVFNEVAKAINSRL